MTGDNPIMLAADSAVALEEIVDLLFDLTDHMRARFSQAAAHFDLSATQARALLRLDRPISMRRLAQRLRCDASNITSMVSSLEEKSLVHRQTSAADRRVRSIAITDKGAALRDQLRAQLSRDVPAIGGLSDDDRLALHDILRRAVSTIRE